MINRWRLFAALLLLLTLTAACCKKMPSDINSGKQIVLQLKPGPGNPRNSEGDFIHLKDGRILFVYTYFTGGGGDHSKAHLAGCFSDDYGKTWTREQAVILPNEGDMNTMSVSLLRLDNGNIAMFYLRKNSETDCIPYMRISTDETKSWGDAKRCIQDTGYYVMNNDRAVQLENGRILLPVALHSWDSQELRNMGKIKCYYSDDNGSTWHCSPEAANPERAVSQEPGIIELNDGKIMLFCRTGSGVQYLSFSEDRGETWSPLKPGKIRSPLSPASVERIPSTGDLMLIWNNNSNSSDKDSGRRTPLSLAISKDEGKSWEKVKTIENNPFGWYCYTAIEFADGHALLGHCSDDLRYTNSLSTTQITRISMDWIYADQTPDPMVVSDKEGIVSLSCPDDQASIYFTLDGSLPSSASTLYNNPIVINRSTLIRMQAFSKDRTPGNTISVNVGIDIYQDASNLTVEPKQGLSFIYYEGMVREVSEIDNLSPVDSGDTPVFSIENRICDEHFAFVFDGYIDIPEDGVYTFYLLSNDGSVLYLNGDKLIDNDRAHGNREESNAASLCKGQHKIMLKYFQQGGARELKLSWKGPGIEKVEIPAERLYQLSL